MVDNAGTGEEGDAEHAAGRSSHDYENLARFLLEMDWSWLGYTSYMDQCVLDWVKTRPWVQKNRIILSGFSLGTEPMMVLGVLNPGIFAFVYNHFLCRTLERAKVMTMPSSRGVRSAPNSIRHLIPGFWKQFDFPDIVAALAPRPVICTEGGLDRDFQLISAAYRTAGAPDSTATSPALQTRPNAGTENICPQGWTETPFSASPMWTRATTSSKKTWSFPGSRAF